MKPKHSFTLIEIVVAMGIFSVIGILLITFVRNSYKIYQQSQLTYSLNDEAQSLTTRVTNGIRGTFDIISAASTAISVHSYFAPNDTTPTQVTLTKSGTSLTLSTIQGVAGVGGGYTYDPATAKTRVISTHMVSAPATPLFRYYDESNALLASPIDIKSIHLIDVTPTVFAQFDATQTAYADTKVELRNLKTNL